MTRQGKRHIRRGICFVVMLALMAGLFCGTALAEGELDVRLQDGAYTQEGDTYTLDNTGGNNRAMSQAQAQTFDYSMNIRLLDAGGAAIVVFGPQGNRFYGVECKQAGTQLNLTSFVDGDAEHPYPNNYLFQNVRVDNIDITAGFVSVRLTLDAEQILRIYINGVLAREHDFSVGIPYREGALGVMTWNARAQFSALTATTQVETVERVFNHNLGEDWQAAGGSWIKTTTGMKGNNQSHGDVFYTSGMNIARTQSFVLEADMHLESGQAAGLTFGIADRTNPKSQWYCVNVDKVMGITKLFKNNGGEVWNINRPLTQEELAKKDFKIRIEYLDGGRMNFYLDGVLVGTHTENDFSGGYIGIMTFQSNATFNHVYYYPVSGSPRLEALSLEGAELLPAFSQDVYAYQVRVPFETDAVTLRAVPSEGFALYVNETEAQANAPVQIPLDVGTQTVYLQVKDTQTGLAGITTLKITRAQDPALAYTEQYRPQIHYSQYAGWCNEPNGMVYFDGEWHLFYQYNEEKTWTSMHWGHAVSEDLIHWEELPIALYPDEHGTIFSGSAAVDRDNTTGFFDGIEGGGLVAIFTHAGGAQQQSLAYSTDRGRTWTKYEGNPVISFPDGDPLQDGAFRDPKVFWHEESGQWMMVVAGGPLRFYSSPDLKTWTYESGYNLPQVINGETVNAIFTECPDFFRLKVEGTNTYKWVMNGCGRYYMIGDFEQIDGKWYFVPDTNEQFVENFAPDAYAAQTYFGWDDEGTPDGRRIMIQWMSNWGYANAIAGLTDPNTGAFTLQHELTLRQTPEGIRMFQNPIKEYETLRIDAQKTVIDAVLTPDGENPLADFSGDVYEICATFTPTQDTTQVGFKLRCGGNEQTLVYYDLRDGRLYIDRTNSGAVPAGNFAGVYSQQTSRTQDGKISMRIFVDWSSVDVFGNDGQTMGTALIYPQFSSTGASVYTQGGNAHVKAEIYPLSSIWRDTPQTPPAAADVTISADDTRVYVDETVTVRARVLPVTASQKVNWTVENLDGSVQIVSQTDTAITLKGITGGQVRVIASVPGTQLRSEGIVRVVEPVFRTNLTGWHTHGGSWTIDETGYLGQGSGDVFTVAQETVEDFVLNAEMTLISGEAMGIVFYADQANASQGAYIANVDLQRGNFRIFEFPYQGAAISDIAVKTFEQLNFTPQTNTPYDVQLTVRDGKMSLTFGGVEIFTDVADENDMRMYTRGKVGFMAYNASVRAQDFFVTTQSPIDRILTEFEDMHITIGDGTAIADLTDGLPNTVTAMQQDGIRRQVKVLRRDAFDVDLTRAGTYVIRGMLEDTQLTARVRVIVAAQQTPGEENPGTGDAGMWMILPAAMAAVSAAAYLLLRRKNAHA